MDDEGTVVERATRADGTVGAADVTASADPSGSADTVAAAGAAAPPRAAEHPAAVTPGLAGRRSELAGLRVDVERASLDTLAGRSVRRARVLLVAGRPGSGRTALAEEFAAELAASGRYPDGLLRARLTEPDGAPVPVERTVRELLGALGETAPAGAEDDELTDILRGVLERRRAVLLLDDVACADQIHELIPDTRGCLLVAVATGPLTGVSDVRPCTLGGLRTGAALRLLARGAGDVRVTVDPTAAERLAELCAHLPAALVLASGWLAAHPEAAVVDAVRRIDQPLPAPPPEPPPEPEERDQDGEEEREAREEAREDADRRQEAPPGVVGQEHQADATAHHVVDQALRRAFWMVHATLPTPAARLLRLLTLAPLGLADAHTAAALAGCPIGTARATLADLARLGLLRPPRATSPPEASPNHQPYLVPGCLTPLLGELLRTREKPADVLLARARMLERTVRLLRSCAAITEPSGSPARVWLAGLPAALRFDARGAAGAWLAGRQSALLTAARHTATDGRLDTLARRLIAALSAALLAHRGAAAAAPELYRLHELALRVAERQRLPREQAAALLNLGDLDARGGRPTEALDRYRAALESAREGRHEHADPPLVGRALESLGATYLDIGDWQRGADWYGRALAHSLSRGDLVGAAWQQGRIATALTRLEDFTGALRAWRAAAAAHRRCGDVAAHARALVEVARVHERAGRPKESLRACREALRHAERTGDGRLEAELRLHLADCAERTGQPAVAADHRAVAEALLARCRVPDAESSATTEGSTYETKI